MLRALTPPDFFIVGAPRCGTTALSRYLAAHPQVCFSRPKEPHYFSKLDGDPCAADLQRDYLDAYFAHRRPEHRAAGEGSVSTLYAPGAIERILRLEPGARFIAMLRNPMEMLPSYHQRLLYLLQEEVEDFAQAWALQPARARGERLPAFCPDPRLLQYAEVARFGAQIGRLFRQAPRGQCLVILFDDFAEKPRKVYEQVLEFLGLDGDARSDFPRKQFSKGYRLRGLQRLLQRPPARLVEGLARRDSRRPSRLRRLRKRLLRWNSVAQPPRPLDAALRRTLQESFASDLEQLSDLLGRDLHHWT